MLLSDIVFAALQIHEKVLEDGMSDVIYHDYHTFEVIPVSYIIKVKRQRIIHKF